MQATATALQRIRKHTRRRRRIKEEEEDGGGEGVVFWVGSGVTVKFCPAQTTLELLLFVF